MKSFLLISFSLILGWIYLTWTQPEQPQQQVIQNNTGTAINALGDVHYTSIQQSTDYKALKEKVDKAKRNIVKLPNDPDFLKELQQAEKNLADFIEGIRKLLTEIDKIPLNSERGLTAKTYFEKGDYQAARDVLDAKEMGKEKLALLQKEEQVEKQREELRNQKNSLAADYILKAKLTALAYQLGDERISQTRQYFEESLELNRTSDSLFEYALFLQEHNQFYDSKELYQEALGIRRELAKANPQVYLPDVAMTLNNLGNLVQADSGRRSEAEKLYQEALKIYRELAKANPQVYLPNVANTLNNLGALVQADSGRHSEAEKFYQEALGIRRELAKANPQVYLPDVANTLTAFGVAYLHWQQPEEAIIYFKEAIEIFSFFAEQAPQVFSGKLELTRRLLQQANEAK